MITPDDLRTIDVLADQPEEGLAWLASVAEERRLAEGERLFRRGEQAERMGLILEGGFQIFFWEGAERRLYTTLRAGALSGLLPFSRMTTFEGEGVAVGPTRLAMVHKDHFWPMMSRMPEVASRLVAAMTDRVREASRTDGQEERMLALGKLAAGLAHELNNPAAAIRRAASELGERLRALPALGARLAGHGLTPDQVEAARGALLTCEAALPGTLSTLDRSEREDRLADWLDDRGVPQPYVAAEVLVESGVTPKALGHLAEHVPEDALGDVVLWIEKGMAAERLLGEIERAAERISGLVGSIKAYSHMDQGHDLRATNVHEGLDQTLTILAHEVKKKQARIERAYADDLPSVCARPGELNQVWTNLLDNALDAIAEGGAVRIATRHEGELVCVAVEDDGPGIPAGVRERIFEPFYTTKPPGQGTGLGLDIAQRIVRQHQGTLRVESEPGRTRFEVCLPLDPEKKAASPEFATTAGV